MARSLVAFLTRHWYRQAPSHSIMTSSRFSYSFAATVGAFGMTLSSTNRLKRKSGDGLKSRARAPVAAIPTFGTLLRRSRNYQTVIGRREIPSDANPKTAPILAAVGEAESRRRCRAVLLAHPRSARSSGCGILLSIQSLGSVRNRFNTGGQTTQVELNAVEPASASESIIIQKRRLTISTMNSSAAVNRKLRDEGSSPNEVEFRVPVAPIVWEAAFKSKQFLE